MGPWSIPRRRPAAGTATPARPGNEPEAQEPPTPERLAELQDAWAELTKAAEGSGITSLRLFRNGRRWEEDPAAPVRGLA